MLDSELKNMRTHKVEVGGSNHAGFTMRNLSVRKAMIKRLVPSIFQGKFELSPVFC